MYQALVRLPSNPQTENGTEQTHARFDWSALVRSLMRLFWPTPRRP